MSYRVLNKQVFSKGEYSIVPIRWEDRYDIMKWRNEQIYHLRQSKPLTKKDQDLYFEQVVSQLFDDEKPQQILFSYLKNDVCIGYGGLVHINWVDKNAEISFIMDTQLENNHFELHWKNFLYLIEDVAFNHLYFHKIFTYAFDIRPHLYHILEKCGFKFEAELKEHCYFKDNFISIKIHSKFKRKIKIRKVEKSDLEVTFLWVNDSKIRAFSFNRHKISLKEHQDWFLSKLKSKDSEYYILLDNGNPVGTIRFDIEDYKFAKINYLIDSHYTGRGLGTLILKKGIEFLKKNKPSIRSVYGYVFKENIASKKIFEKLSFKEVLENDNEIKYEKKIK